MTTEQNQESLRSATSDVPEELLRFLAERTNDVCWSTDERGTLTYVAPQVERLIGVRPDELIGKAIGDLVDPDDFLEAASLQRAILEHANTCTVTYRLKRSGADPIWVDAIVHLMRSSDGTITGFAGWWHDITERRRIELAYEHQAYHDSVTGLPNRRLFEDRLTIAVAQAERTHSRDALLYIDVDRLSQINDTLGHAIGDEVLRMVAHRVSASVRATDTFARLGADDFILLVTNLSHAEDTVRIAQKLLDRLREPITIGTHELFVTVSIGIAVFPTDGKNVSALLASADAAAHVCKRLGGNGWHLHNTAINDRATQRLAVEMELHRALERAEFVVRYQPLLKIADRQITGVEALVRWQHPTRGELAPAAFLDVAEETGLIIGMGQQVIESACTQARDWHEAGWHDAKICVNLSARQFEHPGLLEMIDHAVGRHRVPPSMLQLEITETTALRDVQRSIQLLGELRERGIHVAIDDFGIGYSSLSYLKQLPVSALKIDASFLRGIPRKSDSAIVAAVIAMGHALGLTVIAEGVETAEQMDFLRENECDVCQGYLFSKPTTAADITRLRIG